MISSFFVFEGLHAVCNNKNKRRSLIWRLTSNNFHASSVEFLRFFVPFCFYIRVHYGLNYYYFYAIWKVDGLNFKTSIKFFSIVETPMIFYFTLPWEQLKLLLKLMQLLNFHSFDALESEVLDALCTVLSRVYSIGPLQLLVCQCCVAPSLLIKQWTVDMVAMNKELLWKLITTLKGKKWGCLWKS
jgi:hypothetical protein